ncbi:hypothetical protein [Bradyrhizobium vignae]|uniref:hypothetical protein n=1 Tax=Bradyrhizobium vignae TaxID=1549949 RepID=UPI00100A7EB4|nr:hypothetical protein [Bradyrhizobium vignae]RXG91869.1 hypothetical protein EAV90_27535 [Bradyrhizobium vignae]
MKGHYEAGVALGLIVDDVDGEIARRTENRTMAIKTIGKALDAFSGLMFGSVISAIVIVCFVESPAAAVFAAFLILIGALRLAYFDYFGLDDHGYSTGRPPFYALPALAAVLLVDHMLGRLSSVSSLLPSLYRYHCSTSRHSRSKPRALLCMCSPSA